MVSQSFTGKRCFSSLKILLLAISIQALPGFLLGRGAASDVGRFQFPGDKLKVRMPMVSEEASEKGSFFETSNISIRY